MSKIQLLKEAKNIVADAIKNGLIRSTEKQKRKWQRCGNSTTKEWRRAWRKDYYARNPGLAAAYQRKTYAKFREENPRENAVTGINLPQKTKAQKKKYRAAYRIWSKHKHMVFTTAPIMVSMVLV